MHIDRWRRKWQSTPQFLPGKSHGLRSLMDYSPWGHKGLDTTEHTLRTKKHATEYQSAIKMVGGPMHSTAWKDI